MAFEIIYTNEKLLHYYVDYNNIILMGITVILGCFRGGGGYLKRAIARCNTHPSVNKCKSLTPISMVLIPNINRGIRQ